MVKRRSWISRSWLWASVRPAVIAGGEMGGEEFEVVTEEANKGIEFVYRTVGFDAEVTFWDFGPADEGGGAFVACFRIDLYSHIGRC